jgi:hypothetical protein
MKLVAILVLAAACVHAQTDVFVSAGLGASQTVGADVSTRITWGTSLAAATVPRLVVTAAGTGTISVSMGLAAAISLDAGYGHIGAAAAQVAYTITITASGGGLVVKQLVLETPDITAVASIFTAGNVPGLLMWSTDASARVRIPAQRIAGNPERIQATLPNVATGTFVFVGVQQSINLNYDVDRVVAAEANQTMTFGSGEVAVLFRSRNSGTFRASRSTTGSGTADVRAKAGISLGVYLTFSLSGAAGGTNENHDSEIRYTYTDQQCSAVGISAAMQSGLRLAFYNQNTATWEFPSNNRCDVQSKTVIAATTHFSEWGVFYKSGASSVSASVLMVLALALFSMLLQ